MQPVDLEFLLTCHHNAEVHGIPYVWGAKPATDLHTDQITGSDCSGWSRYLLGRQGIMIPEGSQSQMEWFKEQGLETLTDYTQISATTGLFICFALDTRASGGHAGHVWFLHRPGLPSRAWSMECYGGHGVGSRPWDTPVLRRIFHVGYELQTK